MGPERDRQDRTARPGQQLGPRQVVAPMPAVAVQEDDRGPFGRPLGVPRAEFVAVAGLQADALEFRPGDQRHRLIEPRSLANCRATDPIEPASQSPARTSTAIAHAWPFGGPAWMLRFRSLTSVESFEAPEHYGRPVRFEKARWREGLTPPG